ncbi:uroporphyrinogen-III C-methyltransferase [Vibrio sp. 10N.286.49.B3]|uniref:uroporphyrinogen-III C-methyltransferase n=1 Tax=Vibrio sp. 10N.286.49.B3 TaxID=1880855 RepID=UPI000C849134|nr:uroporphyrinogen-III C-methyltransferase [Vibrio sp. 10N.286.49.B3]PMH41376.1 uroporphyrinogen-III C-methyltransferase [Vibrio sp. 10N.286.49.B3]
MSNSNLTSASLQITAENLPSNGLVSLVGAGPGDPDLLTMKGYRLIQQADVVVYDRLVSDEIMALVNPTAERIYVGKQLDYHCVPQDQINQILLKYAQMGKRVVRLKGGDPFIFGRGGEELETLALSQVPFEVVPGITAAAGCTAYAGIPLTHRDHAQSVQFITGHVQKDGQNINWHSLVQSNHTLVFYMGLKQCSSITKHLIDHGLNTQTPCAIIERGTTPQQRVFTGSLEQLSELAKCAESPALIVIGSVTTLHDKLHWFDKSQ